MRQVWGSVHRKGYFLGEANLWCTIVTNGDFTAYCVRVRQRRDADLFPNYFGKLVMVGPTPHNVPELFRPPDIVVGGLIFY